MVAVERPQRTGLSADLPCRVMSETKRSESETESIPPWRDPDILETLYREQELSLREIASRFGCSKTTVNRWADRLGIQLRPPNHEKQHPSIWTNPKGYTYAETTVDGERALVAIHELVAIASGADPAKVFRPDTQVHYHLGVPGEFDSSHLDIPGNVSIMETQEHLQHHHAGTHEEPTIENLLEGPPGP